MNISTERQYACDRTGETYSVDVGLEDAWLNALNGFDHLYLRSVCEGHPDGSTWASQKRMPILRLSVQFSDAPALQARGDHVQRKISSLFEASPLQGTSTLDHGWSSFDTDEYFIHLDAQRHRTSSDMESWVRDWFSDAIAFLGDIDQLIGSLQPPSGAVA